MQLLNSGAKKSFLSTSLRSIRRTFGRFYVTFIFILFFVLSAASANIDAKESDLTYLLPQDEWLALSFVHEQQALSIPVINSPSQQPISKGIIVLISDLQSHSSSEQHLYSLSQVLSESGWHTLLINPNIQSISKNDEPALALAQDNAQETDPESQITAALQLKPHQMQYADTSYHQHQLTEYMQSILQQLQQDFLQVPGYKIILAEGQSAAILVNLVDKQQVEYFDALVVRNLFWPQSALNQKIPSILANLDIPVLDLVNLYDNKWAKDIQQQKAISARVQVKGFYRQRELIGGRLNEISSAYLAKEIIGWTRYLGW